ncbi:molybdopterin converting factor subunit 1 [soil metagenome]
MTQQLSILYFAWVRESIGWDEDRIDHPGAAVTVAHIVAMLAARGEGYAAAFADPARIRAALDQRFVPLDTLLGDARELALFPPVTGG